MNIRIIVEKWSVRFARIAEWLKHETLPGFGKMSLFDVGRFFVKGLANGTMGIRASAIAFNFFLAMFPALIFLFTLIPYIPIPDFQTELVQLLEQLIPSQTFNIVRDTIDDIAKNPRGGLLSVGCVTTIVLVSNGITAVIKAFNSSINTYENRTFINLRVSSLVTMALITILLSSAIALLIFGRSLLGFLISRNVIYGFASKMLFYMIRWVIILTLCLVSVSVIYYFAPARHTKMGFISPGAVLATTLLLLTSAGFGYYLSNFNSYNALYGSIGTLIAILVWLNLNAYILLLGFELNLSIRVAKKNKI